MGFYLSAHPSGSAHAPVVTPLEYVRLFADALRSIGTPADTDATYAACARRLAEGQTAAVIRALSGRLASRRGDVPAWRLLGIAQLSAGNVRGALAHFETALALCRVRAASAFSLPLALRTRLELALTRLLLLHVRARLGQRDAARILALESLLP